MKSILIFVSALLLAVGVSLSKIVGVFTLGLPHYKVVSPAMNFFVSVDGGYLVNGARGLGFLSQVDVSTFGRVVSIYEVLLAVVLTTLFLVSLAKKTESIV